MEVAGVEGTFRVVCERVMDVLRANKDSLMAVLEAFVHDPLFTWKLVSSPVASNNASNKKPSLAALEPESTQTNDNNNNNNNNNNNQPLYNGLSPVSPLSSDSFSAEVHSVEDSASSRPSVALSHGSAKAGSVGEESFQAPNNRAMQVIERIQKKLTGQDFGPDMLEPKPQVNRLIEEATSEVNLAMMFHGWCSFW